MKYATHLGGLIRPFSAVLFKFAHGSLLAAGFCALMFVTLQTDGNERGVDDEPDLTPAATEQQHSGGLVKATRGMPKLSPEMVRVSDYLARRYRVASVALSPVLATAEATGRGLGLDPLLIVAVIAIESSFNPFAESSVGAQGLMQVIPRFHMDKLGEADGSEALFNPMVNVRVGALVLKEGLERFGSLQNALQYYGGALNDPAAAYASKVLDMKARLARAARRPTV